MKRIALTLLVVAIGQVLCEEPPIVQTKSGKVRGYYRTIDNGDRLMVYEGIRFGKYILLVARGDFSDSFLLQS